MTPEEKIVAATRTERIRPRRANGQSPEEAGVPLLALLWYATLDHVEHQVQLVQKLLIVGSLLVIYGESNSGKTFFALDLALAIAAGIPWRSRRTRRGLVIYVAGEGAASVRARVAAYRRAHPEIQAGIPFAIVSQPVDFLRLESVSSLIETIRAAESESGEKVALVIIDTFARAVAGGDENSAQDVGVAVAGADRIRKETGACVGFVHHTGKDPAKGARGSSALRAATDTEILVEGQMGTRTAVVTKQRDLESGERFGFNLQSIALGNDGDGEPVTSCVIEPMEEVPSTRKQPRGKNQQTMLTAILEWKRAHPDTDILSTIELHAIAKSQGLTRNRRQEAIEKLQEFRWLMPCVGGYRLLPETEA